MRRYFICGKYRQLRDNDLNNGHNLFSGNEMTFTLFNIDEQSCSTRIDSQKINDKHKELI